MATMVWLCLVSVFLWLLQHTKPDRTYVICFKLLANKNPFSFCQETNYNSTMIGTPLISVKNRAALQGEKTTFPILEITNNNNSTHDTDLCLQLNVESSSMIIRIIRQKLKKYAISYLLL